MKALEALNYLMEKTNWNKNRLATVLGVTRQTMNTFFKNTKSPAVDRVIEMADIMGYDVVLIPKGIRKPDNSVFLTVEEPKEAENND